MRSLRVLSICALLSASGCFPHASTSTSTTAGPQTSPTVTVAPSKAPSPHASVSLSTAPVYVITSSAAKPVALPSVTPYNAVKSVSSSGVKPSAPPVAIPSSTVPHILAIHISTLEIRSGETVSGYVTTSDNVAAVDIHISSWAMPIPKTRDGLFRASGVIPDLPFFLKGNYTMQVIARAPTGATAERDIPISLR